MRTHRAAGNTAARVVAVLIVVIVALAIALPHGGQPTGPQGTVAVAPGRGDSVVQPIKNPIGEALKPPAGIARRDGVAAAVLIDTSGSMSEQVSDGKGGKKPKIDIAKRCLADLASQAETFVKKHPDKPFTLGIYEFSGRGGELCRVVIPLGPPNAAAADAALKRMIPSGDTPIGDAMIRAKHDLDMTGMKRLHVLVITDGENNHGYALPDVVAAMSRQDEADRAAMYFIAFDVAASKFAALRSAGATVLGASNQTELQQTLDYILTGKILAEQPETPKK
ncbi:MAG: VWA domain-containing protein [Phycisphaerae bacterium]